MYLHSVVNNLHFVSWYLILKTLPSTFFFLIFTCWHSKLCHKYFNKLGEHIPNLPANLITMSEWIDSPGAFIWTGGSRKSEPSRLSDRCLSSVEGRSLILSDIWRLNGEAWFNCWNPRNEPWRCSMDTVACGLSMAYGLNTGFTGGGSETNRHE
jgi:hypothetical protein